MHQVLEAMNQAHNVYNRDRIQSWAGSELKKVQEITQEAQLKFRAHQAQAWSMFGPGPLGLGRQPQLYETDHMDHDIMLVKNYGCAYASKKNKRRNRPRPKFRAQRLQWTQLVNEAGLGQGWWAKESTTLKINEISGEIYWTADYLNILSQSWINCSRCGPIVNEKWPKSYCWDHL